MNDTSKQARRFVGENHSEDIAYIFEQQVFWEVKAHELYAQLRSTHFREEYRMGALTFEDKRKFIPLQAADRLAFETHKRNVEPNVRRDLWKKLTDQPQHFGRYFESKGFEEFKKVIAEDGKRLVNRPFAGACWSGIVEGCRKPNRSIGAN